VSHGSGAKRLPVNLESVSKQEGLNEKPQGREN